MSLPSDIENTKKEADALATRIVNAKVKNLPVNQADKTKYKLAKDKLKKFAAQSLTVKTKEGEEARDLSAEAYDARLNKDMHSETQNISNFLKAVSQKNYVMANKYLQGVVDGKIKKTISNVLNK
jgi:hypothetical protein